MTVVQLDALLALDTVSVAELGLGSVLADSPDLFRHTFRRGELYNAASSTRGLQCQMLLPASSTDAAPSAPAAHAPAPSTSSQLHWAYGPDIYRHLRAVRTPGDLAIFRREMKL